MEKRLAGLAPGAALVVLATDPMAKIDIPLYCRQNAHAWELNEVGDVLSFAIVKAAD